MIRRVLLIFGVLAFLLFAGVNFVRADTGTYTVTYESADLTIQTDGNVVISYDIAMSVQSGNIPWVTVGLPDSNFVILTHSGNAFSVDERNSGGWTGVRIQLDNTYYAGDSFRFSFMVRQNDFVYKYNDEQASISFTPCWWDNAVTNDLKVTIHIPSEISSRVVTATNPTRYEGSSIIWEWNNVPRGDKKTTGALMPLSAFSHVGSSAPGSSFQLPGWMCDPTFLVPGLIFVVFILNFVRRGRRSTYEDPQMFSGGFQKLFRHINLDCPNDGTRLLRQPIGKATIDFCENCGGIFFDKGEIETLVDDGVNEQQLNVNQTPARQNFTATPTNVCPRCHGTFKKVTETVDGKEINIYPCDGCGGIWLNKGTYQMIKEKRLDQDKMQQQKIKLAGAKEDDFKKAINKPSWWYFYPYIYYPASVQAAYRSNSSACTT